MQIKSRHEQTNAFSDQRQCFIPPTYKWNAHLYLLSISFIKLNIDIEFLSHLYLPPTFNLLHIFPPIPTSF